MPVICEHLKQCFNKKKKNSWAGTFPTPALEQTKNYAYLGINMNTTGKFNKAVNDL